MYAYAGQPDRGQRNPPGGMEGKLQLGFFPFTPRVNVLVLAARGLAGGQPVSGRWHAARGRRAAAAAGGGRTPALRQPAAGGGPAAELSISYLGRPFRRGRER